MTDRTTTVEIPARTAYAVADRIDGTEFQSVDEYVAFVLDQVLAELDRHAGDADDAPVADATEEAPDGEAVADRLESLGYL